jgi:hypothetical protein
MSPPSSNPITDRRINDVLDRLHARAGRELPGLAVHLAWGAVKGLVGRCCIITKNSNISGDLQFWPKTQNTSKINYLRELCNNATYSHRCEHEVEEWEVCASLCPQAAVARPVISRQIWNLFFIS